MRVLTFVFVIYIFFTQTSQANNLAICSFQNQGDSTAEIKISGFEKVIQLLEADYKSVDKKCDGTLYKGRVVICNSTDCKAFDAKKGSSIYFTDADVKGLVQQENWYSFFIPDLLTVNKIETDASYKATGSENSLPGLPHGKVLYDGHPLIIYQDINRILRNAGFGEHPAAKQYQSVESINITSYCGTSQKTYEPTLKDEVFYFDKLIADCRYRYSVKFKNKKVALKGSFKLVSPKNVSRQFDFESKFEHYKSKLKQTPTELRMYLMVPLLKRFNLYYDAKIMVLTLVEKNKQRES